MVAMLCAKKQSSHGIHNDSIMTSFARHDTDHTANSSATLSIPTLTSPPETSRPELCSHGKLPLFAELVWFWDPCELTCCSTVGCCWGLCCFSHCSFIGMLLPLCAGLLVLRTGSCFPSRSTRLFQEGLQLSVGIKGGCIRRLSRALSR